MRMGITGTRRGMTREQRAAFKELFEKLKPTSLAHGDCVGVDDECAVLAAAREGCEVHCWPPSDEALRAFNRLEHVLHKAMTMFARNRKIVENCDVLVAVPYETEHQKTGGTWHTHDYARRNGKRVIVIWPDGRVQDSSEEKKND